jgi:hypothetical protein
MHGQVREAAGDHVICRPRARTPRAWFCNAVDRLAGADPGLIQLRIALHAVIAVAVAIGLAYLFVRLTGAMQLPAGSAPEPVLAATNRAMLIVSMLLSAMVAMQAAMVVQDRTVGDQVLTTLLLLVMLLTSLVLGLLIGPYVVASLIYVVVAMAVAVYVRRFPPRGFSAGMGIFFGAFLGFFLHAELALSDIGWIAAFLGIGALSSLLVRFALLRVDAERTLARMRRTQRARARGLLALCVSALLEDDERRTRKVERRIGRQLVRINESTLIIDAQLAETHPRTAAVEAQRHFDAELTLSNCARFAAALAHDRAPSTVRRRAADALSAVLDDDPPGIARAVAALREADCEGRPTSVLASRLAVSIEGYAQTRADVEGPVSEDEIAEAAGGDFTPAVQLVNSRLPGSVPVSTEASTTPGRGLFDRAAMPTHVRTSVQIAIAGTIALVVGELISPTRVYWAMLTTFLSFVAATNSVEQIRRAVLRVVGTAIGIVVGDVLVHVTGGNIWATLVIILITLFLGIYLVQLNFMFMAIAITVVLSQLYLQLQEFSWSLLVLRLVETAVGAGAVIITVMLIVPLRPQRVFSSGLLLWFTALRRLLDAELDRFDGQREPLRPLVRAVDAAYAALVAAGTPLVAAGTPARPVTLGRRLSQFTDIMAVTSAARLYARSVANLMERAEAGGELLTWANNRQLHAAAEQLRTSAEAIESRLTTGERARYVRSAALVALVLDDVRRRRQSSLTRALHDLTLLDGTLARLATALEMEVEDLDTGEPVGESLGVGDRPCV